MAVYDLENHKIFFEDENFKVEVLIKKDDYGSVLSKVRRIIFECRLVGLIRDSTYREQDYKNSPFMRAFDSYYGKKTWSGKTRGVKDGEC